ncbi:MAG TPA: lysophospholipid acyltransferase family protein [Novosphingobium sp.]|nr:lysophospholipid acyltransferase family protein [Novosphingobium sp.]
MGYWRGARRIVSGLRVAGALAVFLALAGPWLIMPRGWRLRRCWVVVVWRALLAGFGIKVVVHGRPIHGAGTLYVANHISWTDIPVLGMLIDAGFVAKGEIRAWPVIGRLTQAYGCLFVERERRGHAHHQAAAMAQHLEDERALVLFPEGTTGLGEGVLPFRSSLFAAVPGVADGTARVQPVTIRYCRRDGTAFSPAEQRQVAWIDDDELVPHAGALAAMGGLCVEVSFEAPVEAHGRKAIAAACEAAITRRLASESA